LSFVIARALFPPVLALFQESNLLLRRGDCFAKERLAVTSGKEGIAAYLAVTPILAATYYSDSL